MLDVAAPNERTRLTDLIRPQLDDLRGYPYGKHIASKVDPVVAVVVPANEELGRSAAAIATTASSVSDSTADNAPAKE